MDCRLQLVEQAQKAVYHFMGSRRDVAGPGARGRARGCARLHGGRARELRLAGHGARGPAARQASVRQREGR